MQLQTVTFTIDGQIFNPPENWREIEVLSTFDDSINANVEIEELTLVNEAAAYVTDIIEAGKTGGVGIFQGISFTLEFANGTDSIIFDGYLDLTTYIKISPVRITVKGIRIDVEDINTKLTSITYELLKSNGTITAADYTSVKYVVEKEFNTGEFLMLSFATWQMIKITQDQILKVGNRTAELVAAALYFPPQPAQIAKLAIQLALEVVYTVILAQATIRLLKELIEFIYPPLRTYLGLTFQKALEKAFLHLGYSFTSNITDLNYTYLPSKPEGSPREQEGIPNPQDYGYICGDMVALCKKMFNARLRVIGKTVEMHSLNDPIWRNSSSYVMRDHLDEALQYNAKEIVQVRLVSFLTDPSDFQTVQAYRGVSYEISTEEITPPVNPDFKTIKGYDEIRFPVALGTRKDGLTDLEKSLLGVAKAIDAVINLFGGNSSLSAQIRERSGILKVGSRYFNVPKIVLVENGVIPPNHRDRLSAKYLYNTYINQKSLVANDFFEQTAVYSERLRVMTINSFLEAIQNKFFTTSDGRDAEFNVIRWKPDDDTATVDYEVHEVYSTNLVETETEPG